MNISSIKALKNLARKFKYVTRPFLVAFLTGNILRVWKMWDSSIFNLAYPVQECLLVPATAGSSHPTEIAAKSTGGKYNKLQI